MYFTLFLFEITTLPAIKQVTRHLEKTVSRLTASSPSMLFRLLWSAGRSYLQFSFVAPPYIASITRYCRRHTKSAMLSLSNRAVVCKVRLWCRLFFQEVSRACAYCTDRRCGQCDCCVQKRVAKILVQGNVQHWIYCAVCMGHPKHEIYHDEGDHVHDGWFEICEVMKQMCGCPTKRENNDKDDQHFDNFSP